MNCSYDARGVEEKWQRKWEEAKLFESESISGKKKFYIIFAYPNISGFLHIGHMRGYTYTDVIARYKRMNGYNVLFPVGTQPSGNSAIGFAMKVQRGDESWIRYLKENKCDEETIEELKDPMKVVEIFNEHYIKDWKNFGFTADWRRFITTVSEDYKKFIEWQFLKLGENNLLVQKPYFATACIKCGPIAVDPSEMEISRGGQAEKLEYTLIKFKLGDDFILAATLRPETVFGQTNIWVDANIEYAKVKVGDETWIVSDECAKKLKFQKEGTEKIGIISGKEMIGRYCLAPGIEKEIIILPSEFCDPKVGTGIVTSVPSDAPYDYMALLDLKKDEATCKEYGLDLENIKAIEVIPIIKIKKYGDLSAVKICKEMNVENQKDRKLEEATKIAYKEGYHTGVMNENCGKYEGMPVSKAKNAVKGDLVQNNQADIFFDLSEEVICRCGNPVIIKRLEEQWFIKYSDQKLTEDSKRHAGNMDILPSEYHQNLPAILDWFEDRACARLGNWLGTPLPFDREWTIEPIADSTLYPVYYVVSKYFNSGELKIDDMIEEFFDYVYLGKGEPKSDLWKRIRDEFEYWYPLDLNVGGKEHQTVHFPVFLMNHVGILPEKHWPGGIFVNWWVTGKGGKFSKSKGAESIHSAAKRLSVDGIRLYYSHVGNPFIDIEWDEAPVSNYKHRIERMWNLIEELRKIDKEEEKGIDKWIVSRMNDRIRKCGEAMEIYDLREASNDIFFGVENDLRWYIKRGGTSKKTIEYILDIWIRLMSPFTPHLAEELWDKIGNEPFASLAEYPTPDESKIDAMAETSEKYLVSVSKDVSEILKVTKMKPKNIYIYTASEVQIRIFGLGLELKKLGELSVKNIITKAEGLGEKAFIGEYASSIIKELGKWGPSEIEQYTPIDEKGYLEGAKKFLENEFGCKINIYSADEDVHDPKSKRKKAMRSKPGIYIE